MGTKSRLLFANFFLYIIVWGGEQRWYNLFAHALRRQFWQANRKRKVFLKRIIVSEYFKFDILHKTTTKRPFNGQQNNTISAMFLKKHSTTILDCFQEKNFTVAKVLIKLSTPVVRSSLAPQLSHEA